MATKRPALQLQFGKTMLGGVALLGGLYAIARLARPSSPISRADRVVVGAPQARCMDAVLRADLWQANLWAATAATAFFRDNAPTAFMVLRGDPVQGDSTNKPEFAQTLKLDTSAIKTNGMPLDIVISKAELTTKIQNAHGFSYLSLDFRNPAAITDASWDAIGQAIADYLAKNTTMITDAMVRQAAWPEC